MRGLEDGENGYDDAVRFFAFNCTVLGALGGREIGVRFTSSVSCRHASVRTHIAAFSFYSVVIQAYVVNATRQSYISPPCINMDI